jgi:NAD(P)-dependent dehydrogenase (short-subunit alcohol dehydrogenase family)
MDSVWFARAVGTVDERIDDVAGKTIVITGASDGVGAAAARRLTADGENVVIVGRSPEKTKAVAAETGADSFVADFSELDQVRLLAADLKERYPRIDVLANNAGGMVSSDRPTVDGHENVLQVNYLAPFLLTNLLLDRLIESCAKVVNTSSAYQPLIRKVCVDDLLHDGRTSGMKGYALSKIAINMFILELDRRYRSDGLTCAAFHPGWVVSNFAPGSSSRAIALFQATGIGRIIGTTPEQGSDQLAWLATTAAGRDWTSGEYYVKRKAGKNHKITRDPEAARELWDRTAALLAR